MPRANEGWWILLFLLIMVIAIVFNKTKSKDFSVWLPLMLKVMFHKIIQSKILEDGGGNLLLSLLMVIVTAVVFNDEGHEKIYLQSW